MAKTHWIQDAIKNPGALRKKTKTKKNEKISEEALRKASKSKNPTTRKQASLAKTLKSFRRKT